MIMTAKTCTTARNLDDAALDEISGGPVYVKIPSLPGDSRDKAQSADDKVTPIDALVVINELNRG